MTNILIMTKLIKSGITLLIFPLAINVQAQKKAIKIISKVTIGATVGETFNTLCSLERFTEWSPFVVTDPDQKNHVTGVNGELGSTFHWEGVAEKSEGFQTLAAMEGDDYLRMECTISQPYKSQPIFEYQLTKKAGGVEVLQTFTLESSGFSRFMMGLFGVKKKMRAMNQLGLDRLKALLEKKSAEVTQLQ